MSTLYSGWFIFIKNEAFFSWESFGFEGYEENCWKIKWRRSLSGNSFILGAFLSAAALAPIMRQITMDSSVLSKLHCSKSLCHSLFMEYNYKFISPAIKVYCILESEIHRWIRALISLIEIKVNSQLPVCRK